MAGIPYHAAEGYIARLVQKGYRVAVCDQMENPRFAKTLVKRELTRIVTPGTAMERRVASGVLVLPDSIGMLRELREIVAGTDVTRCTFRSNHASNYLPVGGELPRDKAAMLVALDKVLQAPASVQLRPESWRLL